MALPDELFYNTGISTYIWIVTNRKEKDRKGKIQLIDATSFFKKMRKSLGNKRNEVCDPQREDIARLYGDFTAGECVRIFANEDFGYRRITVERPLRLNFAVTEGRLDKVCEAGAFVALAESKKRKNKDAAAAEIMAGERMQDAILEALLPLHKAGVVKNRDKFSQMMKTVFKKVGLTLPPPLFKAVMMALSERTTRLMFARTARATPNPIRSCAITRMFR